MKRKYKLETLTDTYSLSLPIPHEELILKMGLIVGDEIIVDDFQLLVSVSEGHEQLEQLEKVNIFYLNLFLNLYNEEIEESNSYEIDNTLLLELIANKLNNESRDFEELLKTYNNQNLTTEEIQKSVNKEDLLFTINSLRRKARLKKEGGK